MYRVEKIQIEKICYEGLEGHINEKSFVMYHAKNARQRIFHKI
jgi:hypothetical protein